MVSAYGCASLHGCNVNLGLEHEPSPSQNVDAVGERSPNMRTGHCEDTDFVFCIFKYEDTDFVFGPPKTFLPCALPKPTST